MDNFNGNFEDTEYIANAASSTCAGFSPRSSWWRYYNSTQSWCASYFEVLNDAVKIQKENASYKKDGFAPEGIGFLKFGSNLGNLSPYSRSIAVSPGNKYIISAYINTKNLVPVNGNSAFADISIVAFDNVGNILPNGITNYSSDPAYILRSSFGNDWKLYVGYFNVSPIS